VSTLAAVQGDFQQYLLRGATGVAGHVLGTARVPVATRLGIYGDAYRSRLADALRSNFPALARLHDEDFQLLAGAYVDTHDSPYFSIRYYGDELPQFLAAEEHYAGAPILAELARWEWTMSGVFDAADAQPLTPEALTHLAPEQWAFLRLHWHPSVQRLALNWNVPQTWKALTEDSERPPVEYRAAPTQWLLWRQELISYFRSLPDTEAAVLDAARGGRTFGELCELLCAQVGATAAPAQAAALLRDWIAAGLITATA
jgi:hypothetical protein